MVQISKRKVKPEVMDRMFKLLFTVIGKQSGEKKFSNVINGIFSPVEKIMIAKRVAVLLLILKGADWRDIREIVKVSLSSISKCQMILLNNLEMKAVLTSFIANQEMGIFFEELFLLFFGPGTAFINWKKAWKRKHELEKKKSTLL